MAEQESGLDLYYPETKYASRSQQCSLGIDASLYERCDPTSVLDRRSMVGAVLVSAGIELNFFPVAAVFWI